MFGGCRSSDYNQEGTQNVQVYPQHCVALYMVCTVTAQHCVGGGEVGRREIAFDLGCNFPYYGYNDELLLFANHMRVSYC